MQTTILLVLSHSCLCLVFFFLRLLYIASIIRQNRLVICCKVNILESQNGLKLFGFSIAPNMRYQNPNAQPQQPANPQPTYQAPVQETAPQQPQQPTDTQAQ